MSRKKIINSIKRLSKKFIVSNEIKYYFLPKHKFNLILSFFPYESNSKKNSIIFIIRGDNPTGISSWDNLFGKKREFTPIRR